MAYPDPSPGRKCSGAKFSIVRFAAALTLVNLLAACAPSGSAGSTAPPGGAPLPAPDTIVVRDFHVETSNDSEPPPDDLGARTAQQVASAISGAFVRSGMKVRTAPERAVGCDKSCLYVDGNLHDASGAGRRPATVNLLYGIGGASPDLLSSFRDDGTDLPDSVALAVARTFVEHHWLAPQR